MGTRCRRCHDSRNASEHGKKEGRSTISQQTSSSERIAPAVRSFCWVVARPVFVYSCTRTQVTVIRARSGRALKAISQRFQKTVYPPSGTNERPCPGFFPFQMERCIHFALPLFQEGRQCQATGRVFVISGQTVDSETSQCALFLGSQERSFDILFDNNE